MSLSGDVGKETFTGLCHLLQVDEVEERIVEDCLEFLNNVLTEMETPEKFTEQELNECSMGDYVQDKFRQFPAEFGAEGEDRRRGGLRKAVLDWFMRWVEEL